LADLLDLGDGCYVLTAATRDTYAVKAEMRMLRIRPVGHLVVRAIRSDPTVNPTSSTNEVVGSSLTFGIGNGRKVGWGL
jgi:hypothetical protein